MPILFVTITVVILSFIGYNSYEHRNDPEPPPPKPYQISVAPDGTILWAVRVGGEIVYFSTAGTQHSETHYYGKFSTTEQVIVPNRQK